MKHNLKISVSKKPQDGGIVSCRNITIRERLFRFFLGEKQKITILVPGDTVQELAISEAKEDCGESQVNLRKNLEGDS